MNTQTLEQTKEQLRQLETKLEDLQLVSLKSKFETLKFINFH